MRRNKRLAPKIPYKKIKIQNTDTRLERNAVAEETQREKTKKKKKSKKIYTRRDIFQKLLRHNINFVVPKSGGHLSVM